MDEKPSQNLFLERNLMMIYGVTLMAVLGVSSITPAFPQVIEFFGLSPQAVGLLITVFTLPGVFLTPVLGVLADRFGRKRILVPSLFLFALAGTACAFTRDWTTLLALRFIQGIGAAALGSLNVTIIGDLFSGKECTTAMGYNASVLSVGTAAYPAIGGFIAGLGWYYPFALPVLAVPVAFLVWFGLVNPEPERDEHIRDYLKSALKAMLTAKVVGIFLAGVLTFIILYGSFLTYLPILLADSFEASPVDIGLAMSLMSIVTALASSQLGRLGSLFSEKRLLKVAFALYAVGLLLFPFMKSMWAMALPLIVFGLAHGINVPLLHTILVKLAPMNYRAAFMSVNGTVLRLGQTLGPLVMALVYMVFGIAGVFYAGAVCAAMAIVLVYFLVR